MEPFDIPIVGGSYVAPNFLQSQADLINWYCETAGSKDAKEVLALLATPGLNPMVSTQTGQVRGFWVLPGSAQALAVTGNALYLVTISVPATQTTPPVFAVAMVGTLLTNSGQVVMRDNGVLSGGFGGYCLIVDGVYGYYYLLSGTPYTNVFSGSLSIGSPTITFPGTLPPGLIIATTPTLSDTGGVIPAGTTVTAVDTNLLTLTMSANATGNSFTDTVTLTVPVFGRITDPGFPTNPQRLWFVEGWIGVNQGGTRTFQTTGPTTYSMLFPGSFFALKDSSTDNLVTMMEQNREVWLVGERTSEVWFNAGGQNFAFSRIPGVGPQIGCAALHSIARAGDKLVWLGRNEQGQNVVVCTEQYSWRRISTHAIEYAISQYPVVSDAIAYAYEDQGHLFYVLTFPTADATWVFDFTVEDPGAAWHKRLSWDSTAGVYHRHRSNCFMDFGNVRCVGDYTTGQIHQMSRNYYTDAGGVIRRLRRTRAVWKKPSRERVFSSQLQIEFTPGVGTSSGQGSSPQAMLRWSNDQGFTWASEQYADIGRTGDTMNRAMWRLMGFSRGTVFELVYTEPTVADIIGSTLFAEGQ